MTAFLSRGIWQIEKDQKPALPDEQRWS